MKEQHQLSKEMLEALLRGGGGNVADAGASDGYEAFDWSQPCHFSKPQLTLLEELAREYCRKLGQRLTKELRAEVTVGMTGISQRNAVDFAGEIEESSFVVSTSKAGGGERGGLVIEEKLGLAWIDRILGGSAGDGGGRGLLSELDKSLVSEAGAWMVETMVASWEDRGFGKWQVEEGVTQDGGERLRIRDTIFLVVELAVSGGSGEGTVRAALPVGGLEGLAREEGQVRRQPAEGENREADQKKILEHLGVIPVGLSVCLGRGEVTLEELLGLEAGDVVVLEQDIDGEVEMEVGGRTCFAGKPGTLTGRYALEITRAI